MTTQFEFYQAHAVDGQLTQTQMAEMLSLPVGDIDGFLSNGGEPDATSVKVIETTANADPQDAPKPGDAPSSAAPAAAPSAQGAEDPQKSVVLAKDGVHTIPYEKLAEARDEGKKWRTDAEAAQAELAAAREQLATLQAEAQARADAGKAPTQVDQNLATAQAALAAGVDPTIFGDFDEKGIAAGVAKLVDMQIEAKVQAKLDAALAPLLEDKRRSEEAGKLSAQEAHLKAIYTAHPDADSMAESAELKAWLGNQPSIVRAAYENALAKGTTQQVIEVFSEFKKATGTTAAQPSQEEVAAKAKAALAGLKPPTPASLSDIPGGKAAPSDELQAMRDMDAATLMTRLADKTPAQIEAMLARLV